MNNKKSKELYEKGQKQLVGAVNSPVRAFKGVGGDPVFIRRAKHVKIEVHIASIDASYAFKHDYLSWSTSENLFILTADLNCHL